MRNVRGEMVGLEVDLVDALARSMGLDTAVRMVIDDEA
jgi:ABC-type amino acid transport substrate-binding protein